MCTQWNFKGTSWCDERLMCWWGWCWTGLCVVVACVDNDVPFVIWPDSVRVWTKRLSLQEKKLQTGNQLAWCVYFFFYFTCLFCPPQLCSGAIFHLNKTISETFSNCSLSFVLVFLLFPRTQTHVEYKPVLDYVFVYLLICI